VWLGLGREGQVKVLIAAAVFVAGLPHHRSRVGRRVCRRIGRRLLSHPLHRRPSCGQRPLRARFFFVKGAKRRRCCFAIQLLRVAS
jgi:hypothetical protein